jgi:hypothetical protein
VSAGTGAGARAFQESFAAALTDYLHDPSERALRVAYELGREAVSRGLSMLDLAVVHQEALLPALSEASDPAETQRVARAAGDFFLESLSSFEMVQRGFREAREAARLERRQTEMSRQLSTFLADASLALDASDSLEEMLRLVAEQARELVDAECCIATVAMAGQPRTAEAASFADADRRWAGFVRWLDLFAIYRFIRTCGGSVRLAGEQLLEHPQFGSAAGRGPAREWLAAELTALDGSELGAIQLFDKRTGSFTRDDEAVIVHLAQTASAAVERTRLYHEPPSETA